VSYRAQTVHSDCGRHFVLAVCSQCGLALFLRLGQISWVFAGRYQVWLFVIAPASYSYLCAQWHSQSRDAGIFGNDALLVDFQGGHAWGFPWPLCWC